MAFQLTHTHERFFKQAIFPFLLTTVVGLTFSIAVSSIAMGIAIVLYSTALFFFKNKFYRPTDLDYFFVAYAIAELLSTVFSVDPSASLVNAKRLLLISIVYLTVLSVDTRQKYAWAILLLFVVTALLSSVESLLVGSTGGHFTRLSMFQHYMTAGGIKMVVVLMILPFIVEQQAPTRWRVLALLSSIPILLALVLTQTRSSWLGFLAGGITIGIFKSKKFLIGLAAGVVLFFLVAPADFTSRAASMFDPTLTSNLTRIQMITTGWRMFLDYPLFGTGDIDLRQLYITYTEPIDPAEGGHLHNNFMTILVTLGIVGFVAALALFVKIFHVEWKAVQRTKQDWLYGSVAAGCLAVCVGFHINGLFEWNFGDHEIAVLLWFSLGLALVSQRLNETKRETEASIPTHNLDSDGANAHPLSVIIITRNEERNIAECLQSVSWANEIIVVDANSTDRTVELAKQSTPRVYVKQWLGFAAAKNFALEQATNDWVLWLDADERVTPELTREIQDILENSTLTHKSFEVARRAYFLGKWIKHCGWYPGYVVRLFRRETARFNDSRVHEKLEIEGTAGRLKNDLVHYTDHNLIHYFSKFNRYTSLAAQDLWETGKRFSLYDVLVRPPFLFFKMYFLRLGFLDGMHGLILSLISAAYVFVKYVKLWEMQGKK